MKRNIAVIGLVLLLAALAFYQNDRQTSTAVEAAAETAAKPNFQAPEVELTALNGGKLKLGGVREKPLFVNFWASWCGPCEEEAPDLKKLADTYRDRMDFYAVNVTIEDKLPKVEEFVKRYDWDMPVLLDREGAAMNLYRIRGIPTSFLIDESGTVKDVFHFLPREEMERRIRDVLK